MWVLNITVFKVNLPITLRVVTISLTIDNTSRSRIELGYCLDKTWDYQNCIVYIIYSINT